MLSNGFDPRQRVEWIDGRRRFCQIFRTAKAARTFWEALPPGVKAWLYEDGYLMAGSKP